MFDESFLEQTTSDVLDTERPRSEPGEYQATLDTIEPDSFYSEKKGRDYHVLRLMWDVDDAKLRELTGQETNKIRQTIFIDLNASGTGLDFGKGKNTDLGKVRDALGQNVPGAPWSPTNMIGGRATVRVEQDSQGYTNVTGVTKAAV